MSKIAVCIPTRNDQNLPGNLGYPLACLALQTFTDFTIYIRDEGKREAFADRQLALVVNLLATKGIDVRYWRTLDRRGVGYARNEVFAAVRDEPYVLWLDDDMIIESDVVAKLYESIHLHPEIGFVQGTKQEIDVFKGYVNDINRMNANCGEHELVRLWFGDAALLLVRTQALREIDWSVLLRYQLDGLTGEDVSMSLMIADRYEGWGVPEARGWHLSPAARRWQWEPHSDALQAEMLRGKVSRDVIAKAIPHLAPFLPREDGHDAGEPVAT